MRVACAVILLSSLLTTGVFAADSSLAPGKPAGARPAQSVTTVSSVVLGAAAMFGMLLALQSGGSQKLTADVQNNSVAPGTTTP